MSIWDEKSGIDAVDNPIAGTPYDPNRKAWLRSLGGTASVKPQPQDAPIASTRQPMSDAPEQNNWGGASAEVTPASTPMAETTVSAPPTPNPSAAPNPSASLAAGDSDEDALFNRIMKQSMDDTPSNERISDLEGQLAARHPKQTLKSRLLSAAAMAAPVIAGGVFGGAEGAGGAAGGVMDTENLLHQRSEHGDQVLRTQIEAERGRQEHQYERRMQLPVTYMNMKMQRDYRNRVLDTTNRKIDVTHGDALTKMGLNADGSPIPEENLPAAIKGRIMQQRAHSALYDAQEDLAKARAELLRAGNDPNSPVYKLAKAKVDAASLNARSAQERADAMMLSAQTREGAYNMRAFGTDNTGDVLPGTFNDPNTGKPIGWGAPGNPTANTKMRGQTAATVLQHFHSNAKTGEEGIMELINRIPDESLGGLAGHFNEWWLGKYGGEDPLLSQLRTKLNMADTAMMLSHVGQSGGIEMMNHFKSMMNLATGKRNLLVNAAEFEDWLKNYREAGTPNAVAGAPNPAYKPVSEGSDGGIVRPGLVRPSAAPAKGGASKLSKGAVAWEKGPDGKPRPKAAVTVH